MSCRNNLRVQTKENEKYQRFFCLNFFFVVIDCFLFGIPIAEVSSAEDLSLILKGRNHKCYVLFEYLTLPILRLLTSKAQGYKDFLITI